MKNMNYAPQLTRRTTTVSTYENIINAIKNQRLLENYPANVLDYGAGYGRGHNLLQRAWERSTIVSYDPYDVEADHVVKELSNEQRGTFDLVLCIHVLNVCMPSTRGQITTHIDDLLKPGGIAVYVARTYYGDIENTKTGVRGDEVKSILVPQGNNNYTYQRGFDFFELGTEVAWKTNARIRTLDYGKNRPPAVYYKKGER